MSVVTVFAWGAFVGLMFSLTMGIAEGLVGRRPLLVAFGLLLGAGLLASLAVGVESGASTFKPPAYYVGLVIGVAVGIPPGEQAQRDLEVRGRPYLVAKLRGRGGRDR